MALKPATKRATFTDESVNSYKFWTLTAGIDMSMYNENPILLWNHKRADEMLPIGVMQDIQLGADGAMTGLPAFDDQDDFAMKLFNKYEAGMLNMFSVGLDPLEADTKRLKNNAPCLTRCILNEISLTDIGANRNAHKVKLYNKGKVIDLKEANQLVHLFNDNSDTTMFIIPADIKETFKLTDAATEADVFTALRAQHALVTKLTAEKGVAETALKNLETSTQAAKVVALVDTAVKEGKILPVQKEMYVQLATNNYDIVENVFKGLKPHVTLKDHLSEGVDAGTSEELSALIKLSGKDLFMTGKMDRLKKLSLPQFKEKYKEYTGVDFTEESK